MSSEDGSPSDIKFNTNGTKMFIIGKSNDKVFEYTLTTGFDVSTASYSSNSFDISGQETAPNGLAFNTNGTKMFIVGQQTTLFMNMI